MKYSYSNNSLAKLQTCHPNLQAIAKRALEISPVDITIVHGLRGEESQNALVKDGFSTLKYPKSNHNQTKDPDHAGTDGAFFFSDALDFGPYIPGVGIFWKDTHMFAVIAGVFMAAAKELGFKLRWGGDWDMDGQTTDQKFMDWGHIELNWE